jgi:hypothetical protein
VVHTILGLLEQHTAVLKVDTLNRYRYRVYLLVNIYMLLLLQGLKEEEEGTEPEPPQPFMWTED